MLVGLAAEEEAILEWAAFGNVEDAPSACPDFRITKISPALRANLQSVRPCACYETAESFSATAVVDPEAFSCAVCGWKLQAAPQHWRNDTALLFKYGTEGSLQDRFPDSAALRSALSSALDEAGEVRPHCQALVDAIQNPAFQGVLILNCSLTVDPDAPGYCQEWTFLVHSLDWDKFYAKYLIVYQSEAVLKDRQLVLNISGSRRKATSVSKLPVSVWCFRTVLSRVWRVSPSYCWADSSVPPAVETAMWGREVLSWTAAFSTAFSASRSEMPGDFG